MKYRSLLMRRLVSSVNSSTPVQKFIKGFNIKDAVHCVANAWTSATTSTLRNRWHKLWPSSMFTSHSDEGNENNFGRSRVSKEKQLIHELISYAKDVTNPDAKKLSLRINEDALTEWMDVDDNEPTVHHYTDSEIVDMVSSLKRNVGTGSDKDESSDENEEYVRERISIDRLITLTTELLAGLQQRNFVTEQEIMSVYLLQDKRIRGQPKFMKQQTLHDLFKNIARKQEKAAAMSTLDNPLLSTSGQPDVLSSPSTIRPQVEAVLVAEDVITVSDEEDDPYSPFAI